MNYEVNSSTLALIPCGSSRCRAVEDKRTYNLNIDSMRVIEHSCEYFGVSYKSRIEGTKKFVNSKYKNPIVIEETSRIVFFPITSVNRKDTLWVSYNNILEYYPSKTKKSTTVVRFVNGFKMDFPVSFYSFNNQYLKAARLSAVVSDRIIRNY